MKLPEIKLYPSAIPDKWDNIEIQPINEDEDGNCEPVLNNESDIHFYSVYLHDVNGGFMCIADCTSKSEANVLSDLIKITSLNFNNNGYFKM